MTCIKVAGFNTKCAVLQKTYDQFECPKCSVLALQLPRWTNFCTDFHSSIPIEGNDFAQVVISDSIMLATGYDP